MGVPRPLRGRYDLRQVAGVERRSVGDGPDRLSGAVWGLVTPDGLSDRHLGGAVQESRGRCWRVRGHPGVARVGPPREPYRLGRRRAVAGGGGRWRGGLGQVVEVRRQGERGWTVNANIDRVLQLHAGPGASDGLPTRPAPSPK